MSRLAFTLAAIAALTATGCNSTEAADRVARKAVEKWGFSNVTLNAPAWANCSDDADYARHFEAVDAAGAAVAGVVCGSSYGGGWTVRLAPTPSDIRRSGGSELVWSEEEGR